MSDSFMDHIPSHERERIRKRLRSPEAYEKMREKVKGPEDLEKEMRKNEQLAEAKFMLESEPELHDALKGDIEKKITEQGIEAVVDAEALSPETQRALLEAKFTVSLASHPENHNDQLVIIPEGNVQEKIPLKTNLSDQYIGQLMGEA